MSARLVGLSIKFVARVLYKLAFLYLAYEYVTSTMAFYQFMSRAVVAFYRLSMIHST